MQWIRENDDGKKSYFRSKEFKEANERFKMEAAEELGLNLNKNSKNSLTSREAGSIGGRMVKKMIEEYEKNLKG